MNKIQKIIETGDALLEEQRELYVSSVVNLNGRYKELLTNDMGANLVKNCAKDAAGEVVRRFFDTSDYYVTADQFFERIVHFQYDNDIDPLADKNESFRKTLYNMNDDPAFSSTLKDISKQAQEAQEKLFVKKQIVQKNGKTKNDYVDRKMMTEGTSAYRKSKTNKDRVTKDEISGISSKEARIEVDHVQAAATATYNTRYINSPEAVQELKKFYNSKDNFEMLEKRANESKGDVRVFEKDGKQYSSTELVKIKHELTEEKRLKYQQEGMDSAEAKKKAKEEANKQIEKEYSDVTYKASASKVADAVCDRWENANEHTKEELKRTGKLDENGKVPPDVRKRLEEELRHSMNVESVVLLKNMNYNRVADDALSSTGKNLKKIIIGQVIYYVLPPMVFETQTLLKKKNMTLDRYFEEMKKAGKRVIHYVKTKLGNILKAIAGNSFNKFLKTFFDIIIETVKETVKKLIKIAKELAISLVQCVKIIVDKKATAAEKADSVTRILSTTVTAVVLEVLFEYLEKQFSLPDIIMEPLQIIVTILATNLIMLVLEKADLFNVKYGLLVANINSAFLEEKAKFDQKASTLQEKSKESMRLLFNAVSTELYHIQETIVQADLYKEDLQEQMNKINEIFDMGIDFDKEWAYYCGYEVS